MKKDLRMLSSFTKNHILYKSSSLINFWNMYYFKTNGEEFGVSLN